MLNVGRVLKGCGDEIIRFDVDVGMVNGALVVYVGFIVVVVVFVVGID